MKNSYFLLAAALTLSACGGSGNVNSGGGGGDTITGPIITKDFAGIPAGTTVTYNGTADEFTVTVAGVPRVLERSPGDDGFGFQAYLDDASETTVLRFGETASGGGFVRLFSSSDGALDFAGAQFGRSIETELPISGSANYSAGYIGIITDDFNSVTNVVTGVASLTADFNTMEISGEITGRNSTEIGSFAAVVLNLTSIDSDVEFAGTATGGEFTGDGAGFTTADGEYDGLLVGAGGSEVVGGFEIGHTDPDSNEFTETGVFISD